ncbi:unnamed protein product [Symbiodinium necroappetens]|uniref:Uncharacterized protein n=1 Tax=Symbiodinium necroappetens TaxID=1628268 RepID=A0A812TT15_9DINO|nr:unnamed protein product [Symbiodinium necroappetens]
MLSSLHLPFCGNGQVLEVAATGIQIRHLEDDFEETLPLDALGGGKYLLEPVDSDEEATGDVQELLRTGRLRVDATGAGLQLRWVKLGYAVDKASASQRHRKGYIATLAL